MTTTPLTPEAVASLTDAELSEAVARVVFGARQYDFLALPRAPENEWSYTRAKGREVDAVVLRKPPEGAHGLATSLRLMPDCPTAYALVLEHMRQRWAVRYDTGGDGYVPYWSILGESDRWIVSALVDGDSFLERVLGDASGPYLGRCVFAAALLAAQEMEKEV